MEVNEKIKEMIKAKITSYTRLAAMLDVTENTVRKRIKTNGWKPFEIEFIKTKFINHENQ
jgi:uncharacterized protein YjcR